MECTHTHVLEHIQSNHDAVQFTLLLNATLQQTATHYNTLTTLAALPTRDMRNTLFYKKFKTLFCDEFRILFCDEFWIPFL